MTRPRLLDLFCGAGGAAMGYHRAGFDVVGVDIAPQPRYPFDFIPGDALSALPERIAGLRIDAIHASPPCQAYSVTKHMNNARKDHPDLLAPTRDRLAATGLPYVIENVPGAPMIPLIMCCGSAFGLGVRGYQLRRHRWFEVAGMWMMSLPCQHRPPTIGIYGDHGRDRRRGTDKYGHGTNFVNFHARSDSGGEYFPLADRCAAMGIDWMNRGELDQAIPPAYTEYIGRQLLDHLTAGQAS